LAPCGAWAMPTGDVRSGRLGGHDSGCFRRSPQPREGFHHRTTG
jgi:hypothetical protein